MDPTCQAILTARMESGLLPAAPLVSDVTQYTPTQDFFAIIAGWPCPGISIAGRGRGLQDHRSALVSEVFRMADHARPTMP